MVKKAKLPEFLRGYFWDVDFGKIDTDKYKYFIAKRVFLILQVGSGITGAINFQK